MGSKLNARRCSICSINWPYDDAYKKCPKCGENTSPGSNLKPIKPKEAVSIANHARFEQFYEDVWEPNHDSVRLNPDFDPMIAERFPMTLQPDSIPEPEKS